MLKEITSTSKQKLVYSKNDSFMKQGAVIVSYLPNTWTNEALKISGQKAAFWTASDKTNISALSAINPIF